MCAFEEEINLKNTGNNTLIVPSVPTIFLGASSENS
jgi:hypothetical protein